ncbi:unnamed protein product [Choristocarpus tenellus]
MMAETDINEGLNDQPNEATPSPVSNLHYTLPGDEQHREESNGTGAAVSYAAAIRACRQGGNTEPVMSILGRMRWVGVPADEAVYMEAIMALKGARLQLGLEGERGVKGEESAVKVAQWLMTKYEEDGIGADLFLYSAAIMVCAEEGDSASAMQLFIEGRQASSSGNFKAEGDTREKQDLLVNSIEGKEALYTAALKACTISGNGLLARDVFRWMKLDGIDAKASHFDLVIRASCGVSSKGPKDGYVANIKRNWEDWHPSRDRLGNDSARDGFDAQGDRIEWERAFSLLLEMEEKGLEPSAGSCNAVMMACLQAGGTAGEALEVAEIMTAAGHAMDNALVNRLVEEHEQDMERRLAEGEEEPEWDYHPPE